MNYTVYVTALVAYMLWRREVKEGRFADVREQGGVLLATGAKLYWRSYGSSGNYVINGYSGDGSDVKPYQKYGRR